MNMGTSHDANTVRISSRSKPVVSSLTNYSSEPQTIHKKYPPNISGVVVDHNAFVRLVSLYMVTDVNNLKNRCPIWIPSTSHPWPAVRCRRAVECRTQFLGYVKPADAQHRSGLTTNVIVWVNAATGEPWCYYARSPQHPPFSCSGLPQYIQYE